MIEAREIVNLDDGVAITFVLGPDGKDHVVRRIRRGEPGWIWDSVTVLPIEDGTDPNAVPGAE